MTFARIFWPIAVVAALAACSGELGGGQSTLPGTPMSSGGNTIQQIAQAAPTPTPVSASNVATLGDTIAPQALPTVNGWGGTIAFPRLAPATPNPKATASPAASAGVASTAVGITAATVEPTDAPPFGNPKHRGKREAGSVDALFFVSLLATSDVTLAQYPAIALDVPRDIVAKHRDDIFALALYDPSRGGKTFALAVAERDLSSPAPESVVVATPVPTPIPTATPFGMAGAPGALTPPPVGYGLGSSSVLPPERIAFKPTAQSLTLQANRPVVFALYAIAAAPSPTPTPTPKPSPSPRSASPTPTASGLTRPSASPDEKSSAPPSPVPAGTASPVSTLR